MSRKTSFKSESGRELETHPLPTTVMMKEKEGEVEEDDSDEIEKDENCITKIKNRSGGIAIGIFIIGAIFIIVGLCTPYWIESDRSAGSTRFEKIGLWTHCLRSLQDPYDPYVRRFTAGCKVILGLFSSAASEKRLPGLPAFFMVVQFAYALCFLLLLVVFILIPVYLIMMCVNPYHKRYVLIIKLIGHITLVSGFLGLIAVIVFSVKGNSDDTPDLQNRHNYFSWSYACAVIGVLLELISGFFFELEGVVQARMVD